MRVDKSGLCSVGQMADYWGNLMAVLRVILLVASKAVQKADSMVDWWAYLTASYLAELKVCYWDNSLACLKAGMMVERTVDYLVE